MDIALKSGSFWFPRSTCAHILQHPGWNLLCFLETLSVDFRYHYIFAASSFIRLRVYTQLAFSIFFLYECLMFPYLHLKLFVWIRVKIITGKIHITFKIVLMSGQYGSVVEHWTLNQEVLVQFLLLHMSKLWLNSELIFLSLSPSPSLTLK